MAEENEEIVMTPSKKGKTTHIRIEKRKKLDLCDDSSVEHVAGGQNKGLVVNKQAAGDDEDLGRPQLQIGFNCFLVDQKTEERKVESRRLKFWYIEGTDYINQVTTAYEFFKELVQPENFPRDYVGFIKKCMKQMKKPPYYMAKKIDLEIKLLDEGDAPTSPEGNVTTTMLEGDADCSIALAPVAGLAREDTRPIEEILREKLLHILESAYPNILAVEDLVRMTAADETLVMLQLEEMKRKDLIHEVENGKFVRHVLEDEKTDVQIIKQMPTKAVTNTPTIAIITANYSEKLAVDAMMENKTTFVKFKSEGESNVYTMGYIGEHKVVSTKLPAIGHARAAQISSGNTTTRLLGTFQNIEHVFVVGIGGGVPHYTDYYKHVRLGDVVISHCDDNGYIYYYCEKVLREKEGDGICFKKKTYSPREMVLQRVVGKLQERSQNKPDKTPWVKYITEGLEILKNQEANFNRPLPESDRLYMSIGDNNVIEVQHPESPLDGTELHQGVPTIRYGTIGSGRFGRLEQWRLEFAHRYGIRCFDAEFDQVLESIVGNRKDSFMFIRGVADYCDGTRNKEWGPYAALAAAAMMKAIIKMISNQLLSEDED